MAKFNTLRFLSSVAIAILGGRSTSASECIDFSGPGYTCVPKDTPGSTYTLLGRCDPSPWWEPCSELDNSGNPTLAPAPEPTRSPTNNPVPAVHGRRILSSFEIHKLNKEKISINTGEESSEKISNSNVKRPRLKAAV